jgi:hypothetical protein
MLLSQLLPYGFFPACTGQGKADFLVGLPHVTCTGLGTAIPKQRLWSGSRYRAASWLQPVAIKNANYSEIATLFSAHL